MLRFVDLYSPVCVLIVLAAIASPTAGVLSVGEACHTNENLIDRIPGHPGYYARDELDCHFGYRCNAQGRVIKVTNCVPDMPAADPAEELFFSLMVKTCATKQALGGLEVCSIPPESLSLPIGYVCDEGEGDFENPADCASFIKCSVSADPYIMKCGSKTDAFVRSEGRCVRPSNAIGRSISALCGLRPMQAPTFAGSASDCGNQLEGYAAKTDDNSRCRMFYNCAQQEYVFNCPQGTVFSNQESVCIWPRQLNADERAACGIN